MRCMGTTEKERAREIYLFNKVGRKGEGEGKKKKKIQGKKRGLGENEKERGSFSMNNECNYKTSESHFLCRRSYEP